MCTGFIFKGSDTLYGFNLDLDPAVWNYGIYKNKDVFTVGVKVGSTLYYTHGVNRQGHFSNLPYMNGPIAEKNRRGKDVHRIDLLTDRYIRGKYGYADVRSITETQTIVNTKGGSFHSLIGDKDGHILLIEPDFGVREIFGNYAVIANFPILAGLTDFSNPFYGKDRYDRVSEMLSQAGADFSTQDGMRLLESVKQTGQWGTRLSFIYSCQAKTVTYCLEGDFAQIQTHVFTA